MNACQKSKRMRVLFICKKGESYGGFDRKFSGLYNSTNFVNNALASHHEIESKLIQVHDNNCIDREVTAFRPDIVVIEALWVVPEKFEILKKLHPKVQWYIHYHSDVPFLAQEGIAMKWTRGYTEQGVGVLANSMDLIRAICYGFNPFPDMRYLPNCYPTHRFLPVKRGYLHEGELHIGCFGAIRPLKNQLIQMMAAAACARRKGRVLHFHINGNRIEGGALPALHNMEGFANGEDVILHKHEWRDHTQFLALLNSMDALMQVSFSETFNIVSADAISQGIPVVGSDEIEWLSRFTMAKCSDTDDIANKLARVLDWPWLTVLNQWHLEKFARRSRDMWVDFVFDALGE